MTSRNLWHGLLFLQGHIADPDLARALSTPRAAAPRRLSHGALGVLGHVRYLGGRPMHAGHNFDVEEPLVAEVAVGAPAPARAAAATRVAERARQPVAC